MPHRRSGFTLIELLVVIAIIAILAAILFPVFAQARQAARGASSQSNLKQLTLGVLMYAQDYDECYPMAQTWPATGGNVCWGSCSTGRWSSWTFDIAPYLKNAQIFADPLYGKGQPDAWRSAIYPTYGYNYTTLSPSKSAAAPWTFPGTAMGAINYPADTVMLAGIRDVNEGGNWWYGAGTLLWLGLADGPVCWSIPAWCWGDWAVGTNGYNICPTKESGKWTSGVSMRKGDQHNLSFVDGHCKYMTPGAAAQGTDWYWGMPANVIKVTDPTKYRWQVM